MPSSAAEPVRLFDRGSWPEVARIAEVLRRETVGGALLLAATVLALVWVNSPWGDSYTAVRDTVVGPSALHLDLTVQTWAADGLLAVFFFVAGLELKREFVAGDLRDPRRAALPIAAALGGMIVPALLYLTIVRGADDAAARGWAIPIATDIAFALAVLAVVGRSLPTSLRTFLLTLAIVDDLIAITIIAVFFTADLTWAPLIAAAVPLAAFTVLVQRRHRTWWLLLPLAAVTWALVHASGVHATVAGVLLGFAVPVVRSERAGGPGAGPGLAEHLEHRWRPISAGIAVPVFALFAAGVPVGPAALQAAFDDPVTLGVVTGLICGKAVGVLAGAWLVARFTRAQLADDLEWVDIVGLGLLAGIGFTVSLLIGELAFSVGSARDAHVNIAVLTGSVGAALLASLVLRLRNRAHRRLRAAETRDDDATASPRTSQRHPGPR